MVQKIKIFLKRLHILPVTAWDILDKAVELSYHRQARSTCVAILNAIRYFKVEPQDKRCMYADKSPTVYAATFLYFPLHNIKSAEVFGACVRTLDESEYNCHWWPGGIWNTGRRSYLLWLTGVYADDRRDFRKIRRKSLEELKSVK